MNYRESHKIILGFSLLLLYCGCTSGYSQDSAKVDAVFPSKVAAINNLSKKELGISVVSLGMLIEARPGIFFLVDSLKGDGRVPAVQELEDQGYLTVKSIDSAQGELIELTPTAKGTALASALKKISVEKP